MPTDEAPNLGQEQTTTQRGTPVVVQSASPRACRIADDDQGEAEGPCPNCGARMNAIRGSKHAICANCGFKDSCCF